MWPYAQTIFSHLTIFLHQITSERLMQQQAIEAKKRRTSIMERARFLEDADLQREKRQLERKAQKAREEEKVCLLSLIYICI